MRNILSQIISHLRIFFFLAVGQNGRTRQWKSRTLSKRRKRRRREPTIRAGTRRLIRPSRASRVANELSPNWRTLWPSLPNPVKPTSPTRQAAPISKRSLERNAQGNHKHESRALSLPVTPGFCLVQDEPRFPRPG